MSQPQKMFESSGERLYRRFTTWTLPAWGPIFLGILDNQRFMDFLLLRLLPKTNCQECRRFQLPYIQEEQYDKICRALRRHVNLPLITTKCRQRTMVRRTRRRFL